MAPAGKPGVGKGKGKILKLLISLFFSAEKPGVGQGKGKMLKLLISCFLFSSPESLDQDWHRLASRRWAKGKVRKDAYFLFSFQQSRVAGSGLTPAGKPGVGKVKGKILKLLISCFLFSSPGSPDQDWHRLASHGYARGKLRDN